MAVKKDSDSAGSRFRFEELIPGKRTRLSVEEPEKDLLRRQLRLCTQPVVLEAETVIDDEVLDLIGRELRTHGREKAGQAIRSFIVESADGLIYPEVGSRVAITEDDLLVTTPLAKADEHVGEADELKALYRETGEVGVYYRLYNPWGAPKIGIGSKLFYVDRRAVRGFAVVTDFSVHPSSYALVTEMNANTWKWTDPIPCDYDEVKPPQGYAYANRHPYLKGFEEVEVIGDWLDPMPQEKPKRHKK